ncbi:MAG: hypothetical protein SGBAC_007981 [Bacillariaceae sp.]
MHQRQASSGTPLPSIDECLFGPSKKCPKMKPTRASPNTSSPSKPQCPPGGGDLTGFSGTTTAAAAAAATSKAAKSSSTTKESLHHTIDLATLRRVCSQGIADEGSHRGVAWRVLLEYLETDQNIHTHWPQSIPAKRELYNSLVQQYFEGPLERGKDLRGQLSKLLRDRRLRKKYNKLESWDNPRNDPEKYGGGGDDSDSVLSEQTMDSALLPTLNFDSATKIAERLPTREFQEAWKKTGIDLDASNSEFTNQVVNLGINQLAISPSMTQEEFETFLEDAKLLGEVRKDVARTHPDLFFYLEPKDHLGMRRYGALERILFIWAKLNRGVSTRGVACGLLPLTTLVRYVQGMNEIIGTIYYVLANDHNSDWANNAEADAYYLFHSLMMDMKDVFVPEMDDSHTGIQGRIANLQRLLKTHDPEVFEHLQEVGIDASFFAIRWLTTLLSREFLLPDTIRLWDSMFASTHKENFLRYACGTMVMMIRDDLLKGDFSKCLRLLQSYPPGDVDAILETSRSLYLYESQITLVCHRGGVSLHQALQTISPPPSIIMAFGMRGGVAPRISMPFGGGGLSSSSFSSLSPSNKNSKNSNATQAAAASSTTVAAASQGGLFGRVKNLWNKNVVQSNYNNSPQEPAALRKTASGGASSSGGGGGDRNTNKSNNNRSRSSSQDDKNQDETTSTVTTNTAMTAATEATGSTTASRVWNRVRDDNHHDAAAATTTTTTTEIPTRRPIWNRGRSGGSNTK